MSLYICCNMEENVTKIRKSMNLQELKNWKKIELIDWF